MSTHYGNFLRGVFYTLTPIGWAVAVTFHTITGIRRLFPKKETR